MPLPLSSELGELQTQLIAALQSLGGYAGNVALRRAVAWDEDSYWRVRNSLVDSGVLKRGRGRGATVELITAPGDSTPTPSPVTAEAALEREGDLYPPVAKILATDWAKDNRYKQSRVEITARQGQRPTGGTWTRPDVVVVALRVFQYVHGRHFDAITFEVKPWWSIDVKAVYEALARRRAATQAFAWLHIPDHMRDGADPTLQAICQEAKRQGVGVIVASEPGDYDTWDTLVEAERHTPDPEDLNDFITFQLSDETKDHVLAWTK